MASPGATTEPAPIDRRRVALELVLGGVLIGLLIGGLGEALTRLSDASRVQSFDVHVERWLAAHRTGALNGVTLVLTWLAETPVAIALAVLLFIGLRWWTRRWRASVFIATALIGELLVFLAVTALVHRPRPPVHRLDSAPPTSSFPSGHTGAAVALYGGLAVVLVALGKWRQWWALIILLSLVPVAVGLSRMYRGMHHPTDVLAGALNGALWIVLAALLLLRMQDRAVTPARGDDLAVPVRPGRT